MGTTVIDNDWRSMFLDQMSDAEAGRLFKAIMDIRCWVTDVIPDEFKFVLPTMMKFWSDIDAQEELKSERQRQRALKRWHGSSSDSSDPVVAEPKRITKVPSVINYSDDFQKFWDAYPKKKKKAMAYMRWNESIKKWVAPDYLIRKASDYAVECRLQHVEDRYIMYPEGWLNQARYDDDFFTGTKQVDLDSISDGLDDILW